MATALQALEEDLRKATAKNDLPLVVLAAASKDGEFEYIQSFGNIGPKPGAPPASSETMIRLASATKLVTSVAAMQIVERNLIDLDQDIKIVLPEWEQPQLLEGFSEDGQPILKKPHGKMTLRRLLTHTSGLSGLENEKTSKYLTVINDPRPSLFMRVFRNPDPEVRDKAIPELQARMGVLKVDPLSSEPGTNWEYGQGVDWAGRIVERLTNMTLEQHCQEHIFGPLGMSHTTFRPLSKPYGTTLLAEMSLYEPAGKMQPALSFFPLDPKDDMGGSGLFSTSSDYLQLLVSLLRNDGKVLRPETVDLMLDYRLPDNDQLPEFKKFTDEIKDNFGDMAPQNMTVDHCLAGLINTEDLNGGRKANTVTWSGATGCFWWLDRAGGVCGFYGSQLLLLHDKERRGRKHFFRFERAVYDAVKKTGPKSSS